MRYITKPTASGIVQCAQCLQFGHFHDDPITANTNRHHHPNSPDRCLGCEWANSYKQWPPAETFAQFVARRYQAGG